MHPKLKWFHPDGGLWPDVWQANSGKFEMFIGRPFGGSWYGRAELLGLVFFEKLSATDNVDAMAECERRVKERVLSELGELFQ